MHYDGNQFESYKLQSMVIDNGEQKPNQNYTINLNKMDDQLGYLKYVYKYPI